MFPKAPRDHLLSVNDKLYRIVKQSARSSYYSSSWFCLGYFQAGAGNALHRITQSCIDVLKTADCGTLNVLVAGRIILVMQREDAYSYQLCTAGAHIIIITLQHRKLRCTQSVSCWCLKSILPWFGCDLDCQVYQHYVWELCELGRVKGEMP